MKVKSFFIAITSLVVTTFLLFLVGHLFTIPWLMFYYEYTDHANGFNVSMGSFVPVIFGLIASFIAEKIYVYKYRHKQC